MKVCKLSVGTVEVPLLHEAYLAEKSCLITIVCVCLVPSIYSEHKAHTNANVYPPFS